MFRRPLRITLGAFGFPDNGTEIIHKIESVCCSVRPDDNGNAAYSNLSYKAIILKGHDHKGKEKQLAFTIMDGWTDIGIIKSTGTNPDSENSIVVYAETKREKQYGYEPYFLISQVITKESLEDFTDDEIFPIKEIQYTDPQRCGGYGPVIIKLKNGDTKTIDFYGIEGNLQL